ncbi:MAG TPA: FG-GAP-like repeat-containing protein, partial [Segetibacter sp.]
SVQPIIHFGLGKFEEADSLKIVWPDGKEQKKYKIKAGQTLKIDIDDKHNELNLITNEEQQEVKSVGMFSDITGTKGLNYQHKEVEFEDFTIQPLLPHMFSKNGPGIAVGDVNGDGREDFFIGGTAAANGSFFFQSKEGSFIEHPMEKKSSADDMGILLFDADNDNDLDLYIVRGGSENPANSDAYQDGFFENDGKGTFTFIPTALPDTKASGSCVVASDYDHDGDLDLFIGGRVLPGSYPMPPKSYLLRNNSQKPHEGDTSITSSGKVLFTDVTDQVCPKLRSIGMVTSALWSDYDNDGWQDLVLSGEFMPLTFIQNKKGRFLEPRTIKQSRGWWNSIAPGDFDNDGDIDYVVGNLGLNSRHKASIKEPLCIYAKDYDKDGLIDPIICYYVNGKNYLYPTRDEMIKQINSMRRRFPLYADYAKASFEESFLPKELADAYVVKSECFESSYFENKGNGKFIRKSLPVEAQFAPVFGILTGDYNDDGNSDILVAGNSYSTEVSTGRYDAMQGLLLTGDGKGNFKPVKSSVTHFGADKDVKSLVRIKSVDGSDIILAGTNNDQIQAYRIRQKQNLPIPIKNTDSYAIVKKKNGQSYKQEFYYGSNYLSHTSRTLEVSKDVILVSIFDNQGSKREHAPSP